MRKKPQSHGPVLGPPRSARLNQNVTLSPVLGLGEVCGGRGCGASWENVVVVCINVYHVQPPTTVQMAWVELQTLDTSPQVCRLRRFKIRMKVGIGILGCSVSDRDLVCEVSFGELECGCFGVVCVYGFVKMFNVVIVMDLAYDLM